MNLPELLALEPGGDSAMHFSTLKSIAESPQHFRHALVNPLKPTKAMRIGTIVHRLILGPQADHDVVTFEGTRNGKIWDLFKKAHAGDTIVSDKEWEEAEEIADAAKRTDAIKRALDGSRFEVPLRWENSGVPCSTRGIDIVTAGKRKIADLKTAISVNPKKFLRHAERMFYQVQLAHYEDGARENGIDTSGGVELVAIESKPPFAVQVFVLPPDVLDWGRRQLALWIARLKSCADEDFWPAYSQSPVRWEVPAYAIEDDEDDEDDADDEEGNENK